MQKLTATAQTSVPEGVAIMWKEDVDVSITGNSTNPTRFQHPVAGTYRKNVLKQVRNTSQLLPAVVQDVHFTQTTWQQARLPMV